MIVGVILKSTSFGPLSTTVPGNADVEVRGVFGGNEMKLDFGQGEGDGGPQPLQFMVHGGDRRQRHSRRSSRHLTGRRYTIVKNGDGRGSIRFQDKFSPETASPGTEWHKLTVMIPTKDSRQPLKNASSAFDRIESFIASLKWFINSVFSLLKSSKDKATLTNYETLHYIKNGNNLW